MKYVQLETELISLINAGSETAKDGRFITEREISERFDVSRNTVRRAISNLCKQGYLLQIHGKGTYVKGSWQTHPIYSVTRCDRNYGEMGLSSSRTVLHQSKTVASKSIAARLKIEEGDPVLFLQMQYRGDRTVFNVTSSYIPIARFPGIEKTDFSALPLADLMQSQYGAYRKKTENTVDAILPPAEIAEHLEISPDTPVILFESVTSGTINNAYCPFEYFKCYYRTDIMRFHFTQEHEIY